MILLAATIYGIGRASFWPTMLGLVSERFPRGGAMTLNVLGGVGMLGVGIIGVPLLGNIQDRHIVSALEAYDQAHQTTLHDRYVGGEKTSVFGTYRSIDPVKEATAPAADKAAIDEAGTGAKKAALKDVAYLPLVLLACYLGLMLYFKSIGGYRAVDIRHDPSHG
jgi:hypothetical protein